MVKWNFPFLGEHVKVKQFVGCRRPLASQYIKVIQVIRGWSIIYILYIHSPGIYKVILSNLIKKISSSNFHIHVSTLLVFEHLWKGHLHMDLCRIFYTLEVSIIKRCIKKDCIHQILCKLNTNFPHFFSIRPCWIFPYSGYWNDHVASYFWSSTWGMYFNSKPYQWRVMYKELEAIVVERIWQIMYDQLAIAWIQEIFFYEN